MDAKLPLREWEEQRRVIAVYERRHWTVHVWSQPKAIAGSPGGADLMVFAPDRIFWHETKTARGRQRAAQRRFQQLVEAHGEDYVMGGEAEARRYARTVP